MPKRLRSNDIDHDKFGCVDGMGGFKINILRSFPPFCSHSTMYSTKVVLPERNKKTIHHHPDERVFAERTHRVASM